MDCIDIYINNIAFNITILARFFNIRWEEEEEDEEINANAYDTV